MGAGNQADRNPINSHMAQAELLNDVDRALAQSCQGMPTGASRPAPSIYLDERKLLQAALDEPYTGTDTNKFGLSKMVATARAVADQAADGTPWAVEFVFNRLYGRPKQTIATASVSMTLKDYLSALAKGEPPEGILESPDDPNAPSEAELTTDMTGTGTEEEQDGFSI